MTISSPIFRDKTSKQKFALVWIDLGNAEAIANGAVRRRATALAENLQLLTRIGDDIMNGGEITRVIKLRDQRQLFVQSLDDIGRDALRR